MMENLTPLAKLRFKCVSTRSEMDCEMLEGKRVMKRSVQSW